MRKYLLIFMLSLMLFSCKYEPGESEYAVVQGTQLNLGDIQIGVIQVTRESAH